jgi:hypothetical protein
MKKFFTMVTLLNLSLASFSQQTNPSTALNKEDYLLRSRYQKTLAIILVSTGGAVTVIALITGVVGEQLMKLVMLVVAVILYPTLT